jgi:hypothetical protein
MGALWATNDVLKQERLNRAAIIGRLALPVYDVDDASVVRVAAKPIDGDDIITTETTHFTFGSGITVGILHSLTVTNNHSATLPFEVHLVPNGGSRSAATCVAAMKLLQPGETAIFEGPWFLDPSDTLRSISASATAGQIALRGEVTELTGATAGVTLVVDDGSALSTTLTAYYTCPGSGVTHTTVPALTVTNTDTAARTVTVEIRPSGGSQTDRQNILNQLIPAGETVILDGFVLEPGDAIYAKISSGTTGSVRVSPVEFA